MNMGVAPTEGWFSQLLLTLTKFLYWRQHPGWTVGPKWAPTHWQAVLSLSWHQDMLWHDIIAILQHYIMILMLSFYHFDFHISHDVTMTFNKFTKYKLQSNPWYHYAMTFNKFTTVTKYKLQSNHLINSSLHTFSSYHHTTNLYPAAHPTHTSSLQHLCPPPSLSLSPPTTPSLQHLCPPLLFPPQVVEPSENEWWIICRAVLHAQTKKMSLKNQCNISRRFLVSSHVISENRTFSSNEST